MAHLNEVLGLVVEQQCRRGITSARLFDTLDISKPYDAADTQ